MPSPCSLALTTDDQLGPPHISCHQRNNQVASAAPWPHEVTHSWAQTPRGHPLELGRAQLLTGTLRAWPGRRPHGVRTPQALGVEPVGWDCGHSWGLAPSDGLPHILPSIQASLQMQALGNTKALGIQELLVQSP